MGAKNKWFSGRQGDEVNSRCSRHNVEEQTTLKRGETSSAQGGIGTKTKSNSFSQAFRVQNSKRSRPNYDDLTPLNPRETSRVTNTSRAEEKRPPSRQWEKRSGSSGQALRVQNTNIRDAIMIRSDTFESERGLSGA